jgi:hypothetical protein
MARCAWWPKNRHQESPACAKTHSAARSGGHRPITAFPCATSTKSSITTEGYPDRDPRTHSNSPGNAWPRAASVEVAQRRARGRSVRPGGVRGRRCSGGASLVGAGHDQRRSRRSQPPTNQGAGQCRGTRPERIAKRVASALLRAPMRRSTAARCESMVLIERLSSSAISRLERPAAMPSRT